MLATLMVNIPLWLELKKLVLTFPKDKSIFVQDLYRKRPLVE